MMTCILLRLYLIIPPVPTILSVMPFHGKPKLVQMSHLLIIFGSIMKRLIYQWWVTQDATFTQQLNLGIRYFDMRLAPNPDTQHIHLLHGLYAMPLIEALEEILLFLNSHMREIILLHFQHVYQFTNENHNFVIEMVRQVFGSKICPVSANMLTLQELWEEKYQVFIFYSSDKCPLDFWSNHYIPNPWPQTTDPKKLVFFLDENYGNGRPKDRFYVTQVYIILDNKCDFKIVNSQRFSKQNLQHLSPVSVTNYFIYMNSWNGSSYGRPSQSAPNSRKASPVMKPGVSRTPNASPIRSVPQTHNSPAYASYLTTKERRNRVATCTNDFAIRAGDDRDSRIRMHMYSDGDPLDQRCRDEDLKEDLKSFYENLLCGKDDIIKKMEKKVDHLHRELTSVRQAKDKEIDMLRQAAESSSRMVECEFEKRLNDTIAEADKQKMLMHREHTRRVQELLETTNRRLQKMEESYGDRISFLSQMVDELESKLMSLSKDMEQSLMMKKHLKEERDRLDCDMNLLQDQNINYEQRLKELSADYETARERLCEVEMEKSCIQAASDKAIDEFRSQMECEMQRLKDKSAQDEHQKYGFVLQACNGKDLVTSIHFDAKRKSLEQHLVSLKDDLKQTEECHEVQLKECKCQHQQHVQAIEFNHKKEIQEMQREIDNLVRDYSTRVNALEISNSDKEKLICQLKNQMQILSKDFEDKIRREKDCYGRMEIEIKDRDMKIHALREQLAEITSQRDKQIEDACRCSEDQKRQYSEEIRNLNGNIQHLQRVADLQTEDSVRMLEEEKRRCDEKVNKVSEQLKQSICLYEKEANELGKQLEDERSYRCDQVKDLTDQVQQMKRILQQQSDEYMCQVEEEKKQFRKQIQELSKQVEQFRSMCEKQSHDYSKQLEDERHFHQEQMSQMRCQSELDQQELCRRQQKEMESMKRDPQNYVRCLEDKFTKLLTQAEDKAWDQEQKYLKKIGDLEGQLQQLHCDGVIGQRAPGGNPAHSVLRRHPPAEYERNSHCDQDCSRMKLY
uniref:Phosphatidylinositol-specific phospholipase C X domain-containing protein n=1 Tax=Strigamia maritima TaxID=126957 RepID=T1JBT7_STRMM